MIKQEYLDGGLVKTYSDIGVYIHGGYPESDYEEAIDPVRMNRTYVETDRPIPEWEEPETMVSSRNIQAEQYFTVGNHLYFSTASIAVGDDIIVGQNCKELDIAEALNTIEEE